jgi:hypothetical protein
MSETLNDYRCVSCKVVFHLPVEPERCPNCHCRQLVECTRHTPGEDKPLGIEEVVERVAPIIFEAMRWAAKNAEGGNPPPWQNGNSTAESEARRATRAAIEAYEQARVPADEDKPLEALRDIKFGLDFAYEHGVHEFGYDPHEVVRDTILSLKAENDALREALTKVTSLAEREDISDGGKIIFAAVAARAALSNEGVGG